jgi:diacylglycerol O-acyltransferase
MGTARLSALDGSFLRVETPTAHMHVGWKGIFEPRAAGGPVTVEELRGAIAGRLRYAPRFRQRLAFTGGLAGLLGEPVWVDDERFDLAAHVVALAEPGQVLSRARFDELCDAVLSLPLDRGRALWSLHVAPQLQDGSLGLVMKAHHAMVDGKSAVELALLLLDLSPDAPQAEADDWVPRPAPSAARLALDAMVDTSGESLRAAAGLARTVASPRLAGTLRRAALAVGEDLLRPAPSSYVNAPLSPQRILLHHTHALEPLLEAKTKLGVTLNDLALTAVSGALRELAIRAGERPQPLKTMVPVSTRAPEQAADLGNQISFVFVDLPVGMSSCADRLAAVRAATARFKEQDRAAGGAAILGSLGMLPAPVKGAAARMAATPRTYNLTVSNVPGPRTPVWLRGCALREAVPVIPLADGHALSIGIFSYADRITFGAYADPHALAQIGDLPVALCASVLDVCGLAAPPRRRRPALRAVS